MAKTTSPRPPLRGAAVRTFAVVGGLFTRYCGSGRCFAVRQPLRIARPRAYESTCGWALLMLHPPRPADAPGLRLNPTVVANEP